MTTIRPSQGCAEAVNALYQAELESAQQALTRKDAESLHDFRVALRRLRVMVENYAGEGASTRKVHASLKKLLKRSNRARDSEVMLAWLRGVKAQLDETDLVGVRYWQRSLPHHPRSNPRLLQRNGIRLGRLSAHMKNLPLRRKFATLPFSLAAAQCLALHLTVMLKLLQQELAVEPLHQLRLEVKMLRYLLQPFRDTILACGDAEKQLHQLQDQLGLWHDAVIRRESLTRLLTGRVKRLPGKVTRALRRGNGLEVNLLLPEFNGLITLARINGHEEQQLLEYIVSGSLYKGGGPLIASLEHAITTLQQLPAD